MLIIHKLIYSQLKQVTNKDLRRKKIAAWSGTLGRSIVSFFSFLVLYVHGGEMAY